MTDFRDGMNNNEYGEWEEKGVIGKAMCTVLSGALMVMLVGCGQTGALYLPKQHHVSLSSNTNQKESANYGLNQK